MERANEKQVTAVGPGLIGSMALEHLSRCQAPPPPAPPNLLVTIHHHRPCPSPSGFVDWLPSIHHIPLLFPGQNNQILDQFLLVNFNYVPPPLTSRGGYLTCSRIDLIISQARADHFPGTLAPGHATGCIASLSNLIKFQSF